MASPYVSSRQLRSEMQRLRLAAGFPNAGAAADAVGVQRTQVARLESTGGADDERRSINVDLVKQLLQAYGVTPVGDTADTWRQKLRLAYAANETGWWRSRMYKAMGPRQARWANLEYSAKTIRVFELSTIPGVIQTEAYTAALSDAFQAEGVSIDNDAVLAGRRRRQEQLRNTELVVLVEEIAILRPIVPAPIMIEQLQHILELMRSDRLDFRVLDVTAPMVGVRWPREPFVLLTYDDPADPIVAAIEQIGSDIVLIEPRQVEPYEGLFSRCHAAAKAPRATATYLRKAIKALEEATVT